MLCNANKPLCGLFSRHYVSDRFAQILGWTREEIRTLFHDRYAGLISPEDGHLIRMYEVMARNVGHGNAYDERGYRIRSRDGFRWIQNTTMLVDLEPDSFFQGTIADITDFVE